MSAAPSWQVRHFTSLPSTNQYLLEQARSGAVEGLIAVADHQSAGRGRLGRSWESPPGASLLVSVLLRPSLPPSGLHLCPTAVALAALDACASVAGVDARVKWPNDLVVDDRKLAGILAEILPGPPGEQGAAAVVVGLGLNIEWPGPPEAAGTSLAELSGRSIPRDDLLGALLSALGWRRSALVDPSAGTALVAELRARCATLGRRVRVELPHGTLEGTAIDVTDQGLLVVDTARGVLEVAAGDVVHVRTALAGPSGTLN